MRLLHLADRLTDRGGAYRHLLGLLEALAPDHEQLLAVGRDEGTAAASCPVRIVPGLDARTGSPAGLEELAVSFRPDVVHAHNLMNPVVLAWAARRRDTLLTVQDHRYCPTRGKWTRDGLVCREVMRPELCASCFEDQEYFREVFALTEARLAAVRRLPLVVLSSYVKEELRAAGVPGASIDVIPPFVSGLDLEAEADGPPCVLFVGRLVEAKGVAEAMLAWRRSGVGLPLVVAGTGTLRSESLGGPGVELPGWVDRPRLSRLYRRARALVLPSRWQEPFGIVGLEALTFGVPVVAWESGGVGEWHPAEGLVPWGDVDGLARALGEAIGRRATPPAGFDCDVLMGRLTERYRGVAAGRTAFPAS